MFIPKIENPFCEGMTPDRCNAEGCKNCMECWGCASTVEILAREAIIFQEEGRGKHDLCTADHSTLQRVWRGDWGCDKEGLSGALYVLMGFFRDVEAFEAEREDLLAGLTEALLFGGVRQMESLKTTYILNLRKRGVADRAKAKTKANETVEEYGWCCEAYADTCKAVEECTLAIKAETDKSLKKNLKEKLEGLLEDKRETKKEKAQAKIYMDEAVTEWKKWERGEAEED